MDYLQATPRDVFPPEYEDALNARLIGTEQVLWWGRPVPEETGRRFSLAGVVGLAITVFAVYWSHTCIQKALEQPEPDWTLAWLGLPMLLIGVAILYVPVWSALLSRKACYVLTNGRAIVFEALPFGLLRIDNYYPAELRDMVCVEDESGIGNLVFERVASVDKDGIEDAREYGFMGIENVREVEALIRATFPAIEEPPPPAEQCLNEPAADEAVEAGAAAE